MPVIVQATKVSIDSCPPRVPVLVLQKPMDIVVLKQFVDSEAAESHGYRRGLVTVFGIQARLGQLHTLL